MNDVKYVYPEFDDELISMPELSAELEKHKSH